jgi:hypothetical protein
MRTNRLLATVAVGLLLAGLACEDEPLLTPSNAIPIDPLFSRYVSVGNSITAGFQAGGIYDTIQGQAYPVLLARAMQSVFFVPSMNAPGCPAPYSNVFTQTRRPGPACALRKTQSLPPPFISNVAVPGAKVIDPYNNLDPASSANALTTFLLGGFTQMQMLRRARPTFVSVWIGNNDVLGAATSLTNGGDTTLITAAATFQTRYQALLDSIDDAGSSSGVLIGVAKVTAIPFFSSGATYWVLKNATVPSPFPANFIVEANCAPIATGLPGARGDSVLVPFPFGGAKLAAAAAGVSTLSCADTVPQVVVPAELRALVGAVTAYNTFISGRASARGWAYVDPNQALDSLRTIPTQVAPFPTFNAACTANPFGLAFSCDAVHPSSSTHRLIANKVRLAINATYGTNIPAIP